MDTTTTTGIVSNINDPNKAGRIRVRLAELSGQECPVWIRPVQMSGWFWVPEVNEEVEVEIPTGDDLIEFADEMRYRGVVRDETNEVSSQFREGYPKKRGFVTPQGMGVVVDDTQGSESLTLLHKEEVVVRADTTGIFIGSAGAAEPFVLGTTLTNVLVDLVDAILALSVAGVQPGAGVSTGLNPASTTTLTAVKANLQGGNHLSDLIKGVKAR